MGPSRRHGKQWSTFAAAQTDGADAPRRDRLQNVCTSVIGLWCFRFLVPHHCGMPPAFLPAAALGSVMDLPGAPARPTRCLFSDADRMCARRSGSHLRYAGHNRVHGRDPADRLAQTLGAAAPVPASLWCHRGHFPVRQHSKGSEAFVPFLLLILVIPVVHKSGTLRIAERAVSSA